MICPMCNKGKLKKGMTNYRLYGVFVGKYPADICTHCKEAWFDEDTFDKIQSKSKRFGLFGLGRKLRGSYKNGILKLKLPKQFIKNFRSKNPLIVVKPQGKQKLSLQIIAKK